jgi:hypothetical protein
MDTNVRQPAVSTTSRRCRHTDKQEHGQKQIPHFANFTREPNIPRLMLTAIDGVKLSQISRCKNVGGETGT